MSTQALLVQLWDAAQQGNVDRVATRLQQVKNPSIKALRTGRGLFIRGAGTAANLLDEHRDMCDLTHFLFDALRIAAVNDWPDAVAFLADKLWTEIRNASNTRGVRWFDVLAATTFAGSERAMHTLLQSDSFRRIRSGVRYGQRGPLHIHQGNNAMIGHTVLTAAAACGHTGTVKAILMHARVDRLAETDYDDYDALENAVRKGHEDVARVLLEAGAPLCRLNAWPALFSAIEGGHCATVQLLLDAKASANSGPLYPLGIARKARFDVAQMRLHLAANQGPLLPLEYACMRGHRDVVRLLVNAKALVDSATSSRARRGHSQ
jgi:hypothetical protein